MVLFLVTMARSFHSRLWLTLLRADSADIAGEESAISPDLKGNIILKYNQISSF